MTNGPNGSTFQSTSTISIYTEEDSKENTATPFETTPKTMNITSVVNELSPNTNSENIQRESVDSPDTDATNSNVTVQKKKPVCNGSWTIERFGTKHEEKTNPGS